jgi:hypothetical protein
MRLVPDFLKPIALTIALSLAALPYHAPMAQAADGPVLLTVTGQVGNPNRGGFDESSDKFLGFFDVEFDRAYTFTFADLKALNAVTIKADFPKGGPIHSFTGPLLADVLAAAGATGSKVTVQALDGYAVETPLDQMIAQGAVVAYMRDGQMFGIGDFGPTQIVFARAERADLADMSDDNWIWSIFHIRVE